MSTRLGFPSAVATGRGDDGTTGLLFDAARVQKDDLRTEAFGTIDEAVAALGLARAELGSKAQYGALSPNFGSLADLILRIQRELFVVGAELATPPQSRHKQVDGETRVSAAMLEGIEQALRETEPAVKLPWEFIVPGETRVSASLELARTILRRAERRTVTLASTDDAIRGGLVMPYINRLADLLWVLARVAEQAESRPATTARVHGRGRSGVRKSNPTQSATAEGSTL
ncbi:MAG TPA: cob(I)yrinic acid a,c-diamide adenosyltransferase [Candidatus Limnocylindrales bacterium]